MKNQITKLNSQSYIKSRNILRSLRINIAHKGSIFLICAIQIIVTNNYDYIVLEDIYSLIAKKYKNTNIYQIKNTIKYAIDHRIEKKQLIISRKSLVLNTMNIFLQIKISLRKSQILFN